MKQQDVHTRWVILAVGAAIQLLTGIPAAWGAFQPPVQQEYGLEERAVSFGLSVMIAAFGIGCVLGGFLQDKKGPRMAGLVGTGLLCAGFGMVGFVPQGSAWLLYLAFSVPVGLGCAFLYPAVMSCAQKWCQDKKGLATGVIGIAVGLSGGAYTLAVRWMTGRWGIRVCFWVLAAVMLVVCGVRSFLLRNPPESTQPEGTIIRQSPEGNSVVNDSSRVIQVWVSSGEAEEIKMPDLEGNTLTQALGTLDGLNLGLYYDYDSRTSYHDTIPKGSVISTYPTEGTVLHEGQQIILEMSLGPEETPATVPLVVGLTEEAAVKAITDAGLTVGQRVPSASDEQEAGKVWYQSVEAYSSVTSGTSIDIFISTGPSSGSGTDTPAQPTKTIVFDLPDSGSVVRAVIVDSKGNTIHQKEYDTNLEMRTDEITVTGTGQETYTLYIDGEVYDSQTVDFDS